MEGKTRSAAFLPRDREAPAELTQALLDPKQAQRPSSACLLGCDTSAIVADSQSKPLPVQFDFGDDP